MLKSVLKLSAIALGAVIVLGTAQARDVAGGRDHPLVGRYEGSEIRFFKTSEFDAQRVLDRPMNLKEQGADLSDANSRALEGKVMRIRYAAPKDRSALEVFRNYETSLKDKGFETVFTCANEQCLAGDKSYHRLGATLDDSVVNYLYGKGIRYLLAKKTQDQGDVYASVLVGESAAPTVRVTTVDLKPMQGDKIAFIDASAMDKAISATGRVALYGILFDTDKAEIKPASAPTLDEIAKYLKQNPAVGVIVAGHTDNQGAFDYNVDLSRRRAASVVAALATRGIAGARMTPFGAGMAAPTAANDAETGRAKNRRVELVKR